MLYPRFPRPNMTQGCWGTTGLYAALLRTVNIPVTNEEWDLSSAPHRRPVFPSVGLTVTHADDITAGLLRPSTGSLPPLAAPSSSLFYSLDEYESRFVTPDLDCNDDETRCNTEDEQGNYNVERDLLELAYTYRLDGLVIQYVDHDEEYLDAYLRGVFVGGELQEYARPYFADAERATMVAAIIEWVRQQGDGDLEAGRVRVRDRWRRFNDFIGYWPPTP